MTLVKRFREVFGDRLPISFSAGIERHNFADAVALGLKPVTVCTDLLRPGGYGRLATYFQELGTRMDAVGAKTLDEFVTKTAGLADLDRARLENTRRYVATLEKNPRYHASTNSRPPNKVGSTLVLFDCLTCDKCIPVCPNDANFTYALPKVEIPVQKLRPLEGGGFARETTGTLRVAKKHQLANFADFCNECGNCDVFCPEDGGPYLAKPRFFGSLARFREAKSLDGFFVDPGGGAIHGRFAGREFHVRADGARIVYSGEGFELSLDADGSEASVTGRADGEVDLTYFHVLRWLRDGIAADPTSYVNV